MIANIIANKRMILNTEMAERDNFFGLPTVSPPYLASEGATAKDIAAHVRNIIETASSMIYYLVEKARWSIAALRMQ